MPPTTTSTARALALLALQALTAAGCADDGNASRSRRLAAPLPPPAVSADSVTPIGSDEAPEATTDEAGAQGEGLHDASAAEADALADGLVEGKTYEVEAHRNLAYVQDGDPRHTLDVFVPKGKAASPVLVFLHGGAWTAGSKDDATLGYDKLGALFAGRGIMTVMANYRLSPAVMHPEHTRDGAKALAWVAANASRYGGRKDRVFISGHSAGGHIAALLATDARFLQAEGLDAAAVRGVIGIGGVYDVRGFTFVFGFDAWNASPQAHVATAAAPFLVARGTTELLNLAPMADGFHAALVAAGKESSHYVAEGRDHFTEVSAMTRDDPLVLRIAAFLKSRL